MSNPICYLCGRADPDSRDHVPARAIFYPRLPDDLMTAPAHRSCQGSFSRDEAYFASLLDEALWQGRTGWLRFWDRRKAKSGRRSAPAQIEAERIQAVLKKIIQGLYFRHIGRLLSPAVQFNIRPEHGEEEAWDNGVEWQSRGTYGEFRYTWSGSPDKGMIWMLVFHDRFRFQFEVEVGVEDDPDYEKSVVLTTSN